MSASVHEDQVIFEKEPGKGGAACVDVETGASSIA